MDRPDAIMMGIVLAGACLALERYLSTRVLVRQAERIVLAALRSGRMHHTMLEIIVRRELGPVLSVRGFDALLQRLVQQGLVVMTAPELFELTVLGHHRAENPPA